MPLRCTRPDANPRCGVGHGSADLDEGGEDVDLTGGPSRKRLAA
jgi:hypothetical protein